MKITIPFAAVAVLTAMVLAGCSTTSGGGGNTPPPSTPSGSSSSAAATYSNDDLVTILNKANTSLGVNGKVTNVGPISDKDSKTSDIYGQILEAGGTLTPSACGELFVKIANDVATLGENSGAYAARLDYGKSILNATSSASAVDVPTITTTISTDLDNLASQCATVNVNIKGLTAVLHFTKESATTDADTTYSWSEKSTFNGAPVTSVAVIGVDGNLLIGFLGLNGVTISDGETGVNAVVAAAK